MATTAGRRQLGSRAVHRDDERADDDSREANGKDERPGQPHAGAALDEQAAPERQREQEQREREPGDEQRAHLPARLAEHAVPVEHCLERRHGVVRDDEDADAGPAHRVIVVVVSSRP